MIHCSNFWLIQNACGSILKLLDNEDTPEVIWNFHGSHIKGIDTSPNQYYMASTGSDGSVRVWDFYHKNEIVSSKYTAINAKNEKYVTDGTYIKWLPISLCPYGNSFVIGFINGLIRVLSLFNDQLKLSEIIKPHNAEITSIDFNSNCNLMTTTSKDGKLWMFITEKSDARISGVKYILLYILDLFHGDLLQLIKKLIVLNGMNKKIDFY